MLILRSLIVIMALGLAFVPCKAESVLDIVAMIKADLNDESRYRTIMGDEHKIYAFIRNRIDSGSMDDIRALKNELYHIRYEILEKRRVYFSDNTLDVVRTAAKTGDELSNIVAGLSSGAFCSLLGIVTLALWLEYVSELYPKSCVANYVNSHRKAKTHEEWVYDNQKLLKIAGGSLLVTVCSVVSGILLKKSIEKLDAISRERMYLWQNWSEVEKLIEYITYHEGVAAGKAAQ